MKNNRAIMILGGGLIVAVLVCGGGLVALPTLLQGRLTAWADAELDAAAGVDVTLGEVEVTLLSTFPLMTVRATDLVVGEIATLPDAAVGLDLASVLFGDTVEIRSVRLVAPTLNLVTDADAEPSESGGAFSVHLDDLELVDGTLRLASGDVTAQVSNLDMRATGTGSNDALHLVTATSIGALTLEKGGVTWLRDSRWNADVELDVDLGTSVVTLTESRIEVNALAISVGGRIAPRGDALDLDLVLQTAQTDFKALLSLVPGAYGDAFAGVDAGGTFTLGGTVKGAYEGESYPAFDLTLGVEQGRFQYADLPVGVDGIGLDAELRHPQGGLDALEVDVERFAMSVGGTPITGQLSVRKPMSDPAIDLTARGRLDLDRLAKAIPQVAEASPPSGKLQLDMHVAGRSSDFQAQRVDRVQATGSVSGRDLKLVRDDLPPIDIQRLQIELSPARIDIVALTLGWARSTMSVTGRLDNVLPYAMAGETLTGALTLTSDRVVDLRPFQDDDPETEAVDPDAAVVVPVPASLDLTIDASFARFVTSEVRMDEAKSRMSVRDHTVRLESWTGKMLGGDVSMSGSYRAETDEHADVDFQIEALRFDLQKTFAEFETLHRIAPALKGATGRLASDMGLKTRILRDGTPELSLLTSAGVLGSSGVTLEGGALQTVASSLKGDFGSVAPTGNITYAIEEGQLRVQPFAAKVGAVPATVRLSAGVIDQTVDAAIDLAVPTAALKGAPLLSSLKGVVPAKVDVTVTLKGPYAKPKVGVALRAAVVDDVVGAVVDEVKQVASQAIDDLVAAARAQGDALIAAAEKAADKLRDEAKKAGDKLVKDAKGNPLKEAAAKAAAKVLESEADKAGDKLVKDAKAATDKAIADAEAKMKATVK